MEYFTFQPYPMNHDCGTLNDALALLGQRGSATKAGLSGLHRLFASGCQEASLYLGVAYLWGYRVQRNKTIAQKFLDTAMTLEDYTEAVKIVWQIDMKGAKDPRHSQDDWHDGIWDISRVFLDKSAIDESRTEFWLLLSSALGSRHAMKQLSQLYMARHDYALALPWIRYLVQKKDSESNYFLGLLLIEGLGVEPDVLEGFGLLLNAAEEGEPQALLKLAELFTSDKSSPAEIDRAFTFLELLEASFWGGPLYERTVQANLKLARLLWRRDPNHRDYARAISCLARVPDVSHHPEYRIMYTYFCEIELLPRQSILYDLNQIGGPDGLFRNGMIHLSGWAGVFGEEMIAAGQRFKEASQEGSANGQRWFDHISKIMTPREMRQIQENIAVPIPLGNGPLLPRSIISIVIDAVHSEYWETDLWPKIQAQSKPLLPSYFSW